MTNAAFRRAKCTRTKQQRFQLSHSTLAVVATILLGPSTSVGAPSEFVIDPTQSYITMQGTVTYPPGGTYTEQFPGSLTTELSGDIFADTSDPSNIVFEASTAINLVNQSTLAQPGNRLAQLAAQVLNFPSTGATTTIAYSGTVLGTKLSTAQAVGSVLATNQIVFTNTVGLLLSGSVSTLAPGLLNETAPPSIGGTNAAGPGSLQAAGNGQRIVIPISISNNDTVGLNLQLTGQIVATSSVPAGGGSLPSSRTSTRGLIRRRIQSYRTAPSTPDTCSVPGPCHPHT